MNKLIDIKGLAQFLADLKSWVIEYFNSRIDTTIDKTSNNPVANSIIAKAQWIGSSLDVEAAVANGDIIPGYTNIILTDDEEDNFVWCTTKDIYALFGLKYLEEEFI